MVSSPCDGTCLIEDGRCSACDRTRRDIALWGSMTEEQRIERMNELQREYPK